MKCRKCGEDTDRVWWNKTKTVPACDKCKEEIEKIIREFWGIADADKKKAV